MRAAIAALTVTIGLLTACEPGRPETSAEVDIFISQARWNAVCNGFKAEKDDSLRTYIAQKIVEVGGDNPEATKCACEAVMDYPFGPYDVAVVDGFKGSQRDDLTACVLPALDAMGEAESEEVVRLVTQIGDLGSEAAYSKLAELLADSGRPAEVRAAAARGLMPVREAYRSQLLAALGSDPAESVRADVAATLENEKDEGVVAALVKAAREDDSGLVRAAALKAVVKLRIDETDAMVCDLMMNDPDERVRDRAVRSFKGSKRKVALDCLKKRLLTEEKSPKVRESTLKAIYASPDDLAPRILCDAVGPFVRMYVGEVPVHKQPGGADILKHQNNRDYENTHDCAKRALAQGGHSCWGRWYLADWVERTGGNAFKPTCKGMDKPGEISFE